MLFFLFILFCCLFAYFVISLSLVNDSNPQNQHKEETNRLSPIFSSPFTAPTEGGCSRKFSQIPGFAGKRSAKRGCPRKFVKKSEIRNFEKSNLQNFTDDPPKRKRQQLKNHTGEMKKNYFYRVFYRVFLPTHDGEQRPKTIAAPHTPPLPKRFCDTRSLKMSNITKPPPKGP